MGGGNPREKSSHGSSSGGSSSSSSSDSGSGEVVRTARLRSTAESRRRGALLTRLPASSPQPAQGGSDLQLKQFKKRTPTYSSSAPLLFTRNGSAYFSFLFFFLLAPSSGATVGGRLRVSGASTWPGRGTATLAALKPRVVFA